MSKKGGGGGDVPVYQPPPESNMAEYLGPLLSMMTQMTSQSMQMTMQLAEDYKSPALPELPEYKPVDWSERQSQLYNQVKAKAGLEKAKRFGAEDTVLTSSLLDEDEAETTSLLEG